ncbi:MAG: TatD family hydrolase [Thermoflexibacteraceae bacterium]
MTFIDIHTHKIHSKNILTIYNLFLQEYDLFKHQENKYCSIGLHPWHLSLPIDISNLLVNVLPTALTTANNIVAVGETGLDRVITTDFELQKAVFLAHIRLSEQFQKPLIIHCVRAYSDMLGILKAEKPQQAWIFHGFQANATQLKEFLWYPNTYFSFGAALLNRPAVQQVFQTAPIERCFLETDDSTISIKRVYEQAAQLKKITVNLLEEKIYSNFNSIFKITNIT